MDIRLQQPRIMENLMQLFRWYLYTYRQPIYGQRANIIQENTKGLPVNIGNPLVT